MSSAITVSIRYTTRNLNDMIEKAETNLPHYLLLVVMQGFNLTETIHLCFCRYEKVVAIEQVM